MALLDHLADMDRFLGLYSVQKPIRVSRLAAVDSGIGAEVFLWFPNTPYTPANPGNADARFISEVKSILDQLWAADPQPDPTVPPSWDASPYVSGTDRMAITVTHVATTSRMLLPPTVLSNGGRGLRFVIYTGTIKDALEYYRDPASPLLEITFSLGRGQAMSPTPTVIQLDPFEAWHLFSGASAPKKNFSAVSTLAHELCHCFLKATMTETGARLALDLIKLIPPAGKPASQKITNYNHIFEEDIVMNYYEIPAARAFGHGQRSRYSFSPYTSTSLLAGIFQMAQPRNINQLADCKFDLVYWASDSSGTTCIEMVPPDNTMTVIAWAEGILLDWISGVITCVNIGTSSQARGLYRNGVQIYAP